MSFSHSYLAEIVKFSFFIANMFFYAFLSKLFHGGANNPLATLVDAISGDFHNFLFCIGSRIPAQVFNLNSVGTNLMSKFSTAGTSQVDENTPFLNGEHHCAAPNFGRPERDARSPE
ncbi:aquaporin SIP2-1-like [Vicia villosa]|uniref:aquaporin SIP2-1-like n=1 Tax=Vicia villosa TaxID=3911 RepID=UPI00273C51B6|nr:aquaporin SIP2-1-like [Vicia villosa]